MSLLQNSSIVRLALLPMLLLAPACSSSGGSAESAAAGGEVRTPDELPERHRELLLAYGGGPARWESERGQYVTDPELASFLVDNLLLEMFRAYGGSRLAVDGQSVGPFERAQNELVRLAPFSKAPLTEVLRTGDSVVGFLAADTLVLIGPEAVGPVTDLLSDPDRDARRRAAEVLGRLPVSVSDVATRGADADDRRAMDELARVVREDPEWMVRGAAVHSLGVRLAPVYEPSPVNPYRAALQSALRDPDPVVAAEAARSLVRLSDGRLVPVLIDFLDQASTQAESRNLAVAQECVMEASGSRVKRSLQEWRRWWDAHGSTLIEARDRERSARSAP